MSMKTAIFKLSQIFPLGVNTERTFTWLFVTMKVSGHIRSAAISCEF